ncbi:hypothetical protein BaRGS_00037770 [Batillaria attramentaria]|uniref:Uncharacterized protein n=1 Tax=Batillaria attramentaria TaxID=370345 RepID=A0ABD0J7W9_9CAEN
MTHACQPPKYIRHLTRAYPGTTQSSGTSTRDTTHFALHGQTRHDKIVESRKLNVRIIVEHPIGNVTTNCGASHETTSRQIVEHPMRQRHDKLWNIL